jgi:hypothetical protein
MTEYTDLYIAWKRPRVRDPRSTHEGQGAISDIIGQDRLEVRRRIGRQAASICSATSDLATITVHLRRRCASERRWRHADQMARQRGGTAGRSGIMTAALRSRRSSWSRCRRSSLCSRRVVDE